MKTNSLRPSIRETSYRLFDRALHPELFTPAIVAHVKTDRYRVDVGICEGGHFLQFTSGKRSMLEVTSPAHQLLSQFGLQETSVFGVDEELILEACSPFRYHFAGQVDEVDNTVFTRLELELEFEAKRAFLSHQFPSHNRLFAGPISLIKLEGTANSINIHTFHTFPDDMAVLRTQSLFELDER